MERRDGTLTRRHFLQGLGAATVAPFVLGAGASQSRPATQKPIQKPIPSTGEQIPVIGLGTSITFDVPPGPARSALAPVLQAFFDRGGTLVETWELSASRSRLIATYTIKGGPGPNNWDKDNAWVDAKGSFLAAAGASY